MAEGTLSSDANAGERWHGIILVVLNVFALQTSTERQQPDTYRTIVMELSSPKRLGDDMTQWLRQSSIA
jgi:hypothetical protein